jgi:hypothetical protein
MRPSAERSMKKKGLSMRCLGLFPTIGLIETRFLTFSALFFSLGTNRLTEQEDDMRPGAKRSMKKKGSPFSPLRMAGSSDDVRLRLGGTPERNGRMRGEDHE